MTLPLVEEKEGFTTAVLRKPDTQKVTPRQAWLILIIFTIGVFYLSTIREGHLWGDDFSIYISHARNIAEGRPYADTGYIYNPRKVLGPQTYPPVFPLLLAPVYKIWGLNLTAMKVEVILIFLLSLFIIYLAFRGELQWPYLYALVALVGLNPQFWLFKENILSDLPFLLFTYLSFYIIHRAYWTGRTAKSQILYALLISISIFLAYGTRSIGLVLIPCLFVYHVIKRKRTTLFGISIISLTAVFTYVLAKSSHSLNAYADHFGFTTLDFAWTHFKILVNFLSHFWTKGSAKLVPHSLFGVLTGLATVGYLARVVKKQVSCFELFVPFYLTPFTILPIMLEHRFLFPIIPLYLFYAFLGIQTISRLGSAYRRQVERLGFAGVVIVILVSYARQYTALNENTQGLAHSGSEA
jgi:4-amino-4-deoxy-L-arabinose transferase-like glycosyltransferase